MSASALTIRSVQLITFHILLPSTCTMGESIDFVKNIYLYVNLTQFSTTNQSFRNCLHSYDRNWVIIPHQFSPIVHCACSVWIIKSPLKLPLQIVSCVLQTFKLNWIWVLMKISRDKYCCWKVYQLATISLGILQQ